MDWDQHPLGVLYERPSSPPRRQRACLPCSKAKARCNFQQENIGRYCDRCQRLDISCDAQTTKSLRRPRQLKQSISHVPPSLGPSPDWPASLTSSSYSVSSSASPDPSALHFTGNVTPGLFSSSRPHCHVVNHPPPVNGAVCEIYPPFLEDYQSHRPTPDVSASTAPAISLEGLDVSWASAERAVNEFRLDYMPKFPFVVIKPGETARQMQRERPFLFRVVVLVTARIPLEKQRILKDSVTVSLGQHLLVNEERCIDLLQGLLVFIAWGDLCYYVDRQITHLIHLALGYAHNLGLTRVPTMPRVAGEGWLDAYRSELSTHECDPRALSALGKVRSLDEQRAFLGCYYLMSVNSIQFGRCNPFPVQYIDLYSRCLLQVSLSSLDFQLVKLVDLQLLADRIMQQFSSMRQDVQSKTKHFSYFLHDEMLHLKAELDKLMEDVDHASPHCEVLRLRYNYLLVRLYEPAIHLPHVPQSQNGYYRAQCLLYCLQAAKAYFHALLSLPIEGWVFCSFVDSAELLAVLVASLRLLLLDMDGWDLRVARQMLDFAGVCQSLAELFQLTSGILHERLDPPMLDGLGETVTKDTYICQAEKLGFIRDWYLTRIAAGVSFAPSDTGVVQSLQEWTAFAGDDCQILLSILSQNDCSRRWNE